MAKKSKIIKKSKIKSKRIEGQKQKKTLPTFFISRHKKYTVSKQVLKVIKEKEREKGVLHLDKDDFNELGLNDIKYLSLNYEWKFDKNKKNTSLKK